MLPERKNVCVKLNPLNAKNKKVFITETQFYWQGKMQFKIQITSKAYMEQCSFLVILHLSLFIYLFLIL